MTNDIVYLTTFLWPELDYPFVFQNLGEFCVLIFIQLQCMLFLA